MCMLVYRLSIMVSRVALIPIVFKEKIESALTGLPRFGHKNMSEAFFLFPEVGLTRFDPDEDCSESPL